jgi:hypothetical protein
MIGTTWEFRVKERPSYSFIVTVMRLNEKRDAWVCAVILDTDNGHQPGQLVEFEEPDINRWFKRIG